MNANRKTDYRTASEVFCFLFVITGIIACLFVYKWHDAVVALKKCNTGSGTYYNEKVFLSAIDSLDDVSLRLHELRKRADKVDRQLDSMIDFRSH